MQPPAPYDLAVIGGGAAGFFGALAYAEARPGARVCILEKAPVVLGKVRISGGGRCNVTHACFDPQRLTQFYPRGARELRGAFSRFQPADTMDWFEKRNVPLKTEPDGRVFPVSNSSQTIIDCFQAEARRLQIDVRCHNPVAGLRVLSPYLFQLDIRGGESLTARQVLLACGGDQGGFALAKSLGHSIVPPVPSLFTFNIPDPRLGGLAGISVADTYLSLPEAQVEARGPLLITHWGLSGPAVLRLSAWGARALFESNYHMPLQVNWIPATSAAAAAEMFAGLRTSAGRRQILGHSPLAELSLRLWKQLAAGVGISEELTWANLPRKQLEALVNQLVGGRFTVEGKGQFKDEFVTCGGVDLKEVDFRSMQSRKTPGLYLAGEVLDIDGLTGGFNFQNAWTTAWIAGQAIARYS